MNPTLRLSIALSLFSLGLSLPSRTSHEDHTAIFIHGLGGTKASREKQALYLSTWIYQHPPGAGSKITAIENKAEQPKQVDDKSSEEVLRYLTEAFMLQHTTGEIRLVIFCHSNGAKVARKALQKESLQRVLKERYPTRVHDVLSLIKTIRSNTAVVTFGGVSLIPDDLAELVLNFRFEDDNYSLMSHYLGYGDHGEPNTYYRLPAYPERKEHLPTSRLMKVTDYLTGGSVASSQFLSNQESGSIGSIDSSDSRSSSSDNPHYFDKYLESKAMIDYIIKMLGLPNRY